MLSQQPSAIPVLPLKDLTDKQDTKSIRNLILYEPDASEVFDAIVPEYLAGLIYGAVCESVASELAARRTAMEAATNNAEEMIEKLNLHYNRARQASITQGDHRDLLEVRRVYDHRIVCYKETAK